jgi:curli biogenesis system outer membrane secretion channel CsgG
VWREHTKKFSPQWFAAVHAAVPFIAMLRKSVVMPRTAMAFTIAASIVGQTIGSRAERIRLRNQAAKGTGDSSTNTAMYPNKNGNCSNTEGKAWDPLTTKITGSVARGSPAPTPSMCF